MSRLSFGSRAYEIRCEMRGTSLPGAAPSESSIPVVADAGFDKTRNSVEVLAPRSALQLERSGSDFRRLVETVSDYAVYMLTPDGVISTWNKGAQLKKGYTALEAVGLHFSSFYTPEDRQSGAPEKALREAAKSKFEGYGWRVRKDGSRFWAHVIVEGIRDGTGLLLGFAKVTCDVTEQKFEHDALVRNLDAALSNMSQGLVFFDAKESLVLANSRLCEIYDIAPQQIPPGTPYRDFVRTVVKASHRGSDMETAADHRYRQHRRLIRQPEGGSIVEQHGADVVLSIIHRTMNDGSWVSTVEDISERSRAQTQFAHLASHDPLTDLPNRVAFRQRLVETLNRVKRGGICAVFCLDLDSFKTVNDTLGHPVGDALLISVADRLRKLTRETDTVARIGGDEFAMIQTDVRHARDAAALAERIVETLGGPHEIAGHLVSGGVSVGIALAPKDSNDPDQLMKCADLALYGAKNDGRGRYCHFEPEMDALLRRRRSLEVDLRRALVAKEFELYYQPIVDIQRHEACGFEALLRWNSPRRGMVMPDEFIPLAEEIGLVGDIGNWVLESACKEAVRWPDDIKIAVNVSVAQFKGFGLLDAVQSALRISGLAPGRLEIEVTESIMIKDSKHACEVLHSLKRMGLSISMDDFGTGYSSLGYLRSFPFDKIKIDSSFILGMETEADCRAIVSAVMGICTSLGIVATAEGVETETQMDMLRHHNCDQAQGFLISRPFPASDISKMLSVIKEEARSA